MIECQSYFEPRKNKIGGCILPLLVVIIIIIILGITTQMLVVVIT